MEGRHLSNRIHRSLWSIGYIGCARPSMNRACQSSLEMTFRTIEIKLSFRTSSFIRITSDHIVVSDDGCSMCSDVSFTTTNTLFSLDTTGDHKRGNNNIKDWRTVL
jgi:hypothetical protein